MNAAQNTVSSIMAITNYYDKDVGVPKWEAINQSVYPDGMPLITNGRNVYPYYRMLLRPTNLTEFMAAMFWVDALAERNRAPKRLILPFIPGARQDRLNDTGDCLFTAKSIAKEINMRNFEEVSVIDPHSEVSPALIDRCKVWHSHVFSSLTSVLNGKYAGIISPDAGAEKRALNMAKELDIPLYHAWKTRNVKDGKITGFGCETLPKTGNFLIVDDICDGGGTFIGLREAIRLQSEATCDLFVTHGVFSKGAKHLKKGFNHIICTDSIPNIPNEVTVINICERL
jgi:ribose-phosphate pyrophosphokinase